MTENVNVNKMFSQSGTHAVISRVQIELSLFHMHVLITGIDAILPGRTKEFIFTEAGVATREIMGTFLQIFGPYKPLLFEFGCFVGS